MTYSSVTGISEFLFIISLMGISMCYFIYETKHRLSTKTKKNRSNHILLFGILAFLIGIFAQAISIFQVFQNIELLDYSKKILGEGIKLSFIPSGYGFLILSISLISWVHIRKKNSL